MTQQTLSSGADVAEAALRNPEVVAARLGLFSAARDDVQELSTLTDEEIAGLNALELDPAFPAPWFATLSLDEKQIAIGAALRGLTARGLYYVESVPEGSDEMHPQVATHLLAMLTMRHFAARVYVAERVLDGRADHAVVFDQGEGIWLAEYIDHRGLHQFRLGTADASVDMLNTWSGGSVCGGRPDLDVVLTVGEADSAPAVLAPVAASTVGVHITGIEVANASGPTTSAVFSTKNKGAYVVTRQPDGRLRYRGAGSDDVRAHWAALLA
jgi:hypothetical protein